LAVTIRAAVIASTAAVRGGGGHPNDRQRETGRSPERTKEFSMFLGLFVILLLMWLLGFFAFHVAGGLIHLLLIIAVISLVVHLFRGRSIA
jgi:hypothetical protein